MKKANILITLCVFTACTFTLSCQKEQALINKIEGAYKIEKVVYIVNNRDSVVLNSNSTMYFDQCKLKKQEGPQQCDGYYEIEGQNRIGINYRPEEFGGKEQMVINIGDSRLKPFFGGNYIIEARKDNSLILARYINDQFGDKIYNLRIFLKK